MDEDRRFVNWARDRPANWVMGTPHRLREEAKRQLRRRFGIALHDDSSLTQTVDNESARGFPGGEAEEEIHSHALADSVETTTLPQTPLPYKAEAPNEAAVDKVETPDEAETPDETEAPDEAETLTETETPDEAEAPDEAETKGEPITFADKEVATRTMAPSFNSFDAIVRRMANLAATSRSEGVLLPVDVAMDRGVWRRLRDYLALFEAAGFDLVRCLA